MWDYPLSPKMWLWNKVSSVLDLFPEGKWKELNGIWGNSHLNEITKTGPQKSKSVTLLFKLKNFSKHGKNIEN